MGAARDLVARGDHADAQPAREEPGSRRDAAECYLGPRRPSEFFVLSEVSNTTYT